MGRKERAPQPLTPQAIYDGRWQGDRPWVHRWPWLVFLALPLMLPLVVVAGMWSVGIREAIADYWTECKDAPQRVRDWRDVKRQKGSSR